MPDNVLYQTHNRVAHLTLNRPEKRNALSAESIAGLVAMISKAEADAASAVILIDGAGKDFCSGADLAALKDAQQQGVMANLQDAERMGRLFLQMRKCAKPVVAAVHGRALAGGCGLATACDILLASDSASFGYPEVNIGFVPAMVMAILRRSVSEKAAFEMIATGEILTAARAYELGVVQRVFPAATFALDSIAYAEKLAAKPATAVALSKRLLYHMDSMNFEAALEAGVQANVIARLTDDCKQGVEKFLNRNA